MKVSLIFAAFSLCLLAPEIEAGNNCCPPPVPVGMDPYCCGDNCNWLCCDCDVPCRTEPAMFCAPATLLNLLGGERTEASSARSVFDSIDTDKNNAISFEEFTKAARAGATKKDFDGMDVNGDGVINPSELDKDLQ